MRMYDDAFQTWLETSLRDPSEGVQRSLRRPTFAGFGAQRIATTARSIACGAPAGS